MATKKELCRSANGIFIRNLGWKVTPTGAYVQHKFYLGKDESAARLASIRLEKLWSEVQVRWTRENDFELQPTSRPVWDPVTLSIAEAIRDGRQVARVPLPTPFSAMIPESPMIGDWLDKLQKDISVIKVELLDVQAQEKSEEYLRNQGRRLLDMGREMLHRKAGGETLYAAWDAFIKWIEGKYVDMEKRLTQFGSMQKRQITFLKRHIADRPLSELDSRQIEEILETIRLRPAGKNRKPVSVGWTQNCLKQFRSFLRWLNKSPEFAWKRPSDLELSPMRIPVTSQERTGVMRSSQVQTYSLDELKLLWNFATPFQRLLLLLALNGGFGRSEIASLEMADVILRRPHPHAREVGYSGTPEDSWIFRMRSKTGVYGEFKLWPETVQAIDWWLKQRQMITIEPGITSLLVNQDGRRLDTPTKSNNPNGHIPNTWFQLTQRVKAAHPEFRKLSFNKLRKTAGNLVRLEAHGEIAAVFLCHGRPVKSDELLDLYTNRPFGKVFHALDKVGDRLRHLWTDVANAFSWARKETKTTLSRHTIRRVHCMKKQGYKMSAIAETLAISIEAARHASRQSLVEKQ